MALKTLLTASPRHSRHRSGAGPLVRGDNFTPDKRDDDQVRGQLPLHGDRMVGHQVETVTACSSGRYVPAGTKDLSFTDVLPAPGKRMAPADVTTTCRGPIPRREHIHMTTIPDWAADTVAPQDNDGTHTWHTSQRLVVPLDLPRSASHNPHLEHPAVGVVKNRMDVPHEDGTVTEGDIFYWVDVRASSGDLEGSKAELARAFEQILAAIPDDPA